MPINSSIGLNLSATGNSKHRTDKAERKNHRYLKDPLNMGLLQVAEVVGFYLGLREVCISLSRC